MSADAAAALPPQERLPRRRGSRRGKIVAAAAELFAAGGYPAAGMDQIGAAAGITGPGIYRHFDSKAAILAAVFDGIIDAVTREPVQPTPSGPVPDEAGPDKNATHALPPSGESAELSASSRLMAHVRIYADAVAARRELMSVFVREVHHLPPEHQLSLAERQRSLVRTWRDMLATAHPTWTPEVVRTTVHGAFGMLNALGTFSSPMSDQDLAATLGAMAGRMMDLPPQSTVSVDRQSDR